MADDVFFEGELKGEELLKLMHELRADRSNEKMLGVLKCAAASDFLVPVDVKDGKFSFHAVGDNKGRRFIVVYGDSGSFKTLEKDEHQKCVRASFEDVMQTVLEPSLNLDGMIINPGASEVIFGKELLQSINGQMSPQDDGVDMQVLDAANFPPRMKGLVEGFAREEKRLKKVWVRILKSTETEELKWLIVLSLDVEGDERDYIIDTFSRYITPCLEGVESVVTGDDKDWVQDAIKDTEPFYERT